MKHIFPYMLLLLALLSACGDDAADKFTLTLSLDVPDQTYLYFRQEEMKEGIRLDSVLHEKGKAVYKGTCEDFARIEVSTEAGQRLLSLYVKNGEKVKIKGSITSPYEIEFSGTPAHELWGGFRNDNHELLTRLDEADRTFYTHIGDTAYADTTATLRDSLHHRVIAFVRKNSTSTAATILLYDYLLAPGTVEAADTLLRSIAPEAKPVALLAKAELFINEARKNSLGKLLPYMTFRTPGDSVINTGGFRRRTTLLTVWASYDSLSRRHMQVVRELQKKHPAAYLNIVGLSLDGDNDDWLAALRADSLDMWAQCRLEEGWNASQVENLGVQHLPATFVLNGTGRIIAKNVFDDMLVRIVDSTVNVVGKDTLFGVKPIRRSLTQKK